MSSGYLARLVGLAIVSLPAASAHAQEYPARSFPNKPVRIVASDIAKWTAVAKAANIKAD